jgi:hypothetical protein
MDANLQEIVNLCSVVDQELTDQSNIIAGLSMGLLDELQAISQGSAEATNWVQPANAGDSGGSDPSKPSGVFQLTSGVVGTWSAKPAYAHNNGYWYTKRKGAQYDKARAFLQMLHVSFDNATQMNACEAFEFEIQQSLNGEVFDMAWQVRKPATSGAVFTFDKRPATHGWKPTSMVIPPSVWKPGAMIPIAVTSRRNSDQTFSYLTFAANGKQLLTSPIVQPCLLSTESNYVSIGFQLDTNDKATAYSLKTESFRVVYSG